MEGTRHVPIMKILTEDQVDQVHEATLAILGRTGVRLDAPEAVQRLVKDGAVRKEEKPNVVLFPRSMVEDSLNKVPRFRKYFARNPKNDIVWDGEHTFAGSVGGNPSMLDMTTGEPHPSTLADVEQSTRVMDALENCHAISNFVVATDVPGELQVVKTVEAMIKNTSKCVSSYALNTENVDALAKMWSCLTGGLEGLRKRPLFCVYGSPSSPLTFDRNTCEIMTRGAELGVPIDIVPCPMCGGTAPVTLAGGLAQQNAELLAGIMLYQTVDDSLPTCYSGRLTTLDLRTGANIWGTAEMGLASAAAVQIAHRYHMGADVYGVVSDVNAYDVQMGLERMMAGLIPALAGADMLSGIGGAWGTSSAFEMLVLDNEIYGDIFRALRGIQVDEDRLATGLIDRVGHMGNFLAQPHTMKYLKMGELRISDLWDKRGIDRFKKEGFKPTQERAKAVVRRILSEHEPEPLDRDVARELERVVSEVSKSLT